MDDLFAQAAAALATGYTVGIAFVVLVLLTKPNKGI